MMALKILLVSEYFPPKIFGGGEISAEHLANALVGAGISVSVLTSRASGLEEFEQRNGIRIYRRLNTGKTPASIYSNIRRKLLLPNSIRKEIKRLDREQKFDIIHFLNTSSIIGLNGKRTITTINGYGNFCPKGNLFYRERWVCSGCGVLRFPLCILNSGYAGKLKLRFWLRFNPGFWILAYWNFWRRNRILRQIDEFIAISGFIENLLLREGIPGSRIHRIPNVISIMDSGKEYPLELKGHVMTYVGSLEKIKGVDLLIDAFNHIRIKEQATLLIVGDGSERKKLEEIANERVRFLGKMKYEYMPSIYKQSDVIVLPARWPEPLPRVLIEAMYFGKPVIATKVGGNPDCIEDGRNGFLVKAEVKELRKRIEKLLSSEGLRERMGRESRRIFQERFDRDKIVDKLIKLYESGQVNKYTQKDN